MMASVYPTNSTIWYSFFPDFGKFEYINPIHFENGSFSTGTETSNARRNSKFVFSQRERLRQEKFAQVGKPAHATFVFSTRGCARRVREASRREAMPQALRHATRSLLLRRSTQNSK